MTTPYHGPRTELQDRPENHSIPGLILAIFVLLVVTPITFVGFILFRLLTYPFARK